MIKLSYYIILLLFALTSCEEYYHADLDKVENMLVVESLICNDPVQNFVRISKTANFNDQGIPDSLKYTSCWLVDDIGNLLPGEEQTPGYFRFSDVPRSGHYYKLRITYGTDTFESDYEMMPPVPLLDSTFAVAAPNTYYATDAFGNPYKKTDNGFDVRINAPIHEANSYYRFKWRAILQWSMEPESAGGPPPPKIYGWRSYYDNDIFNIAGPKEYAVSDMIENHTVLFRSTEPLRYLDSTAMTPEGWIVMIHQYGITKSSFTFYDKVNDQLEASGQLFDPVYTQVYGNIHCTTDPDKIILGHFDLCSYHESRYFVYALQSSTVSRQHIIDSYNSIPDEGMYIDGSVPYFWVN